MVLNLPKFTAVFDNRPTMDEAEMQAECGDWTFTLMQWDPVTERVVQIDTNAFNKDLTDVNSMTMSISSYEKEYARSTTGNVLYDFRVLGNFAHYPRNNQRIWFKVYMADPCYTLEYEPYFVRVNDYFREPGSFNGIEIETFPHGPTNTIYFGNFTEYVDEIDPFTNTISPQENETYCGAVNYTLEYQTTHDPYDPQVVKNVYRDDRTGLWAIDVEVMSNVYNNSIHLFNLIVSARDA